jgi:hypothetical protein
VALGKLLPGNLVNIYRFMASPPFFSFFMRYHWLRN